MPEEVIGGGGDGNPEGNVQDPGQQDGNGQQQRTQDPDPGQGNQNQEWEAQRRAIIADLQKERKARQEFERNFAATQAQLEQERKRVLALTGVTPQSDEDLNKQEIRNRLKQVVDREFLAEMLGISPEDLDSIKNLKEQAASFEETQKALWDRHAREMVKDLGTHVLEAMGGEKLTDRQQRSLLSAFAYAVDSDPNILQRFHNGDKGVIEEFAKEWIEDWFEPARRKITQQEANRFRRVPSGQGRKVATTKIKDIDPTDDTQLAELLSSGFEERLARQGG